MPNINPKCNSSNAMAKRKTPSRLAATGMAANGSTTKHCLQNDSFSVTTLSPKFPSPEHPDGLRRLALMHSFLASQKRLRQQALQRNPFLNTIEPKEREALSQAVEASFLPNDILPYLIFLDKSEYINKKGQYSGENVHKKLIALMHQSTNFMAILENFITLSREHFPHLSENQHKTVAYNIFKRYCVEVIAVRYDTQASTLAIKLPRYQAQKALAVVCDRFVEVTKRMTTYRWSQFPHRLPIVIPSARYPDAD